MYRCLTYTYIYFHPYICLYLFILRDYNSFLLFFFFNLTIFYLIVLNKIKIKN